MLWTPRVILFTDLYDDIAGAAPPGSDNAEDPVK